MASPSRTGRASPDRCSSGINFAKALAWVHDKPLVGVNHLEGHVYAAWLLDPGEDEATKPAPEFPLVALVVSGGHTFLAEMRDHLTYRLLGTTVDDAAGEAFDKVGRLLGLGYPGGPAIQKAAEGAVRRDVVFPRAWMGDSYDLSFSGLKTAARRIVAEARAEEGLPADDPAATLSAATTAELAWGFQDSVVDVLTTKAIRAAREIGARSIVLGGGVAANSVLRERLAGESEALGRTADRAAPGPVHGQRGDDRRRRRPPVRGRRACRTGARCAAVAAAGDPVTDRPGRGPRHAARRRPARPPCAVAELPGRHGRALADPRGGRSGARRPRARDRAGSRAPDRRACSTPVPRSRRSSSTAASPGSCRSASSRRSRRAASGSSRATRSTRISSASSSRPTTSSRTCRTTSRARSCTRCWARHPGRDGSC